jgi:hypothetical protein
MSAVEAGLKNAEAVPWTAWSAASCQMWASPATSSAAIAPWLAKRTASAPTMTPRRGRRSPTTPPTSRKATSGTVRAASTMPRSEADPVSSSTANASATGTIPSPTSEIAWPVKSRRNSRSRKTSRLRGARMAREVSPAKG